MSEIKITKESINELFNKIANYRGVIIQDSINVEAMLGSIIINYFIMENKHSEFLTKVIEDENFSFGFKINIINQINFETYEGFIEDLRRINNIRNIFAHCLPGSVTTGALSYYNKNKKKEELAELKDFHEEFITKVVKVNDQLNKIFWKLVYESNRKKSNENKTN